jgi:hypothetical protein
MTTTDRSGQLWEREAATVIFLVVGPPQPARLGQLHPVVRLDDSYKFRIGRSELFLEPDRSPWDHNSCFKRIA